MVAATELLPVTPVELPCARPIYPMNTCGRPMRVVAVYTTVTTTGCAIPPARESAVPRRSINCETLQGTTGDSAPALQDLKNDPNSFLSRIFFITLNKTRFRGPRIGDVIHESPKTKFLR